MVSRQEVAPGVSVEARYDPERAAVLVTVREETRKTVHVDRERADEHAITLVVPRQAMREAAVTEGDHPIPILLDSYGVWNAANPNLDYFMDWIKQMDLATVEEIRGALDERENAIIKENTES
jgi:hypothetical protein